MKKEIFDTGLEVAKKHSSMLIGFLFPQVEAFDAYKDSIRNDSELTDLEKAIKLHTARNDFKHIINQNKIAQIANDSAKEGTDFSDKSGVNEDFIDRFMDSAKFVSDENLQAMWGKVLAGEFENPNSTPMSVIRILTELTQEQAEAFAIVCSCTMADDEWKKFTLIPQDFLSGQKFRFPPNTIRDLNSLGLLSFRSSGDYVTCGDLSVKFQLLYHEHKLTVFTDSKGKLPTGCVVLTSAGIALFNSVEKKEIPGFFDDVKRYFKSRKIKFVEENDT